MRFIERRSRKAASRAAADETFEQVQLEFYQRLRKDRATLGHLKTALGAGIAHPSAVLEELATFAHRLRGAAAIFAAQEIRDAAEELEAAARASRQAFDSPGLVTVGEALTRLQSLLSAAIESAASETGAP